MTFKQKKKTKINLVFFFVCFFVCFFFFGSIQPHLCDPGFHLDPDAGHHTGSLSYPTNHIAAHAAEGDPAHRYGKFHVVFPASHTQAAQLYLYSNLEAKSQGCGGLLDRFPAVSAKGG